jgi:hypothetical protein
MQHIQEESSRYLNKATRKRQNKYQLFVCLTNIVDEHSRRLLANDKDIYTQSGTPCGITYLKLLIQIAEIDIRATASHIRCCLTQLDTNMINEAKRNIIQFNEHVHDLMNSLSTKGETSNNIIVNFFLRIYGMY